MTDTETSTETSTETKKNHFGGRQHRIDQLGLLLERVEKLEAVFIDTEVGAQLAIAADKVDAAISAAEGLSAEWKPAGRTASHKTKFVPTDGATVKIRKKKVESGDYEVLSAEDQQNLTVISVKGKFASCRAASGAMINVRVSHLSPRK